jgi:hypothetical protein
MTRTLVKTIHNTNAPLWIITLSTDGKAQEFAVYSPDLDTAIYEVLTDQMSVKSAIVSITKN